MLAAMHVVHVHVHVVPDRVEDFRAATLENARASVTTEPGVLRFDVCQESAAPERFVLVEVYREEADAARHKETAHYRAWREAVEPMMAEPRRGVRLRVAFPDEPAAWTTELG